MYLCPEQKPERDDFLEYCTDQIVVAALLSSVEISIVFLTGLWIVLVRRPLTLPVRLWLLLKTFLMSVVFMTFGAPFTLHLRSLLGFVRMVLFPPGFILLVVFYPCLIVWTLVVSFHVVIQTIRPLS